MTVITIYWILVEYEIASFYLYRKLKLKILINHIANSIVHFPKALGLLFTP